MPGPLRSFSATMGMSKMRYRRFLAWSSLAGVIWSTYTCVLAVIFVVIRKQRRKTAFQAESETPAA